MGRKGQPPEQIITKLRESEVFLAKGKMGVETCRALGVCNQTFYRWHNEYGGLKVDQTKKLKALERENARREKVVAELILDKLFLQEAVRGNF